MSSEDRRRQLLGIGLRMLVERPIQDLSIDAVAAEAGISRGLLFHYFPTKTDYYDAVIGAALRRVVRNVSPDEGAEPEEALRQFVGRFFAQIERRREFYLALVFGNGAISLGGEGVDSHRMAIARRVAAALGLADDRLPVVHAWSAYVEDRALQWSGRPVADRLDVAAEVRHCCAALEALIALAPPG
ncbi:MAG: TetR/AcrR family transcriptional regulator [Nocardioides sp.]|uniref:TetR/AcrR family transcriptional regulator n=1 Tax=Nocardioides sp. TaxID=35761 RepID=UPI0039E295AA